MIIAVDFDGTIKKHPGLIMNELQDDCKEVLQEFHNQGHKLILWTCRYGDLLYEAIEYLKKYDLYRLFDAINENVKETNFNTSHKIYADIYIDDLIIGGFPGWKNIREYVINKTII